MKKFNDIVKSVVIKYGKTIVACAFAFVVVASNTSCLFPYYEIEEPDGLERFKKFNM